MRVWVRFDGPPQPGGPSFIEVEDEAGMSVSVEWRDNGDGTWSLGPFTTEETK